MSAATVTQLRPGRLTDAEYERERATLKELYGDSPIEAAAKRDQALAVLFYRSGWTQEELAKKEGRSQSWVDYRLRFGRFLHFTTGVVNSESTRNNLTEGRFRSYWEKTDKSDTNERTRFREVSRLMAAQTTLSKPHVPYRLGHEIMAKYADGKWHALDTIAAHIDGPADQVKATLDLMQNRGNYNSKCEIKTVGAKRHYRIFHQEKTISSQELTEKLGPIIKGLKEEGKKNTATMSPGTVARLAALLQQQLDEWSK